MIKFPSARIATLASGLIGLATIVSTPANAASIDLQPTFIPGSAATGGPSFVTATFWAPGDTLHAIITGTVNFDKNNNGNFDAEWNAAGVVVQTFTSGLAVGGSSPYYINQGWLRLALGNSNIGYYPLLEVSTANGFGSSKPPTILQLDRKVSDIFASPGFAGISKGTVLQYRIFDTPTYDNTGGFAVSVVPEPQSWLLFGLGLFAIMSCSRKQTAQPSKA